MRTFTYLLFILLAASTSIFGQGITETLLYNSSNGPIEQFAYYRQGDLLAFHNGAGLVLVRDAATVNSVATVLTEVTYLNAGDMEMYTADLTSGIDFGFDDSGYLFLRSGTEGDGHFVIFAGFDLLGGVPAFTPTLEAIGGSIIVNVHVGDSRLPGRAEEDFEFDTDFITFGAFADEAVVDRFRTDNYIRSARIADNETVPAWLSADGKNIAFVVAGEVIFHNQAEENWPMPAIDLLMGNYARFTQGPGGSGNPTQHYVATTQVPGQVVVFRKEIAGQLDYEEPWEAGDFEIFDAQNNRPFVQIGVPMNTTVSGEVLQRNQYALLDDQGELFLYQAQLNSMCSLVDSIAVGGVDYFQYRDKQTLYVARGSTLSEVDLNEYVCETPLEAFVANSDTVFAVFDTVVCIGQTVTISGVQFDGDDPAGTITYPGAGIGGTDSILNVTVSFFEVSESELDLTVCPGETVMIVGEMYAEEDIPPFITFPGAAANGCDSTLIINLTIRSAEDMECGGTNPGEMGFDCLPESSPLCLSQEQTTIGGQACVDFNTSNFEDIIAFQFSVEFDPGQIGYSEIVLSDQLPGLTVEDNFELQRTNEGIITLSYNLLTGESLTLDDGTSLFQVCFTGLSGGLAPVTVSDTILGSTEVVYSDFSESVYAGNVGSVEVILCSDTTITIDTLVCLGETVTFDNTSIAAAGTYTQTVQTAAGCDSTTILNLAINEVEFSFPASIGFCPGETRRVTGPDSVVIGLLATPDDMLAANLILPLGGSIVKIREVASGCIRTQEVNVFEFTPALVTVTGVREYCENEAGTSVTAGGAQSYLWSTGDTTATVFLTAGAYTVTGTDNNGCETTEEVVIETLPLPDLSLQGALTYCSGDDGATVTVTGGQTYTFSNGATTPTATLPAGEYFVVGTGVNGCSDTLAFVVEELPLPDATISGETTYCADGDGVTLTASGGLSYRWSDDTEGAVNNVLAGEYTVTVTGENGCSAVASVIVEELPLPEIDIEGPTAYCVGDAGATVTATGGETYVWSTGAATATVTLEAGSYMVTVTDGNGCEAISEITITENPLPVVRILGDPNVCPQDGGALLTATGGNFYQWSTGASTASIVAPVGTYGVTVTNDNGCSASSNITVVGDTISPVILACPADRRGVLNFEQTEVAINWNEPFAEDNCGVPTLTGPFGGANGGLYAEGTTTISYEAVDEAGNSSGCSFNVTVRRSDDLTFYVDGDGVAVENGVVCIPIRVRDFTEVVTFGVAFSLPNIPGVEYVATVPGQEVSATAGEGFFAAQNNGQNEVAVTYLNVEGAGLTLPDEALAFMIKATLPGAPGDCFDISTVLDLIAVEALQLGIGETVPTLIPGEVCLPNRFGVTGRTYRPNPELSPIDATDVERESSDGSDDFDITDLAGRYAFEELDGNVMHTFTPERDFEHRAGLTVLDMARMIFHIRGIDFITDPYLIIAANVNDDDRISLLDINPVRRVILGTIGEFPGNKSWRFLPVDYVIDPLAPINEYDESATLPGLDQDEVVDFYGVKIGDLNYSQTNFREGPGEGESVSFSVQERWLTAGEEVRVTVQYDAEQPRLLGYQQSWTYEPRSLSLVRATAGDQHYKDLAITDDASNGVVRAVYLDYDPGAGNEMNKASNSEVLVMNFKVHKSGWLSDALAWTPDENMPSLAAVGERPREVKVAVAFTGNDNRHQFAVRVNPNPVEDEATATLSLPSEGNWELTLLDVQGRIIGITKGVALGAGKTRAAVPGLRNLKSGTYYLHLQSGDQTVVTSLIKQ